MLDCGVLIGQGCHARPLTLHELVPSWDKAVKNYTAVLKISLHAVNFLMMAPTVGAQAKPFRGLLVRHVQYGRLQQEYSQLLEEVKAELPWN